MAVGAAHRFDSTILREYDIRGTVGDNLDVQDAWAVGRAFAKAVAIAGGSRIAVGYDGRLSSPALEAALVEGSVASGLEVIRIGRGPTPMLYFAVHHLDLDGAVMVTGSHNPPDQNGFKLMLGKSSLDGQGIQQLGEIAARGNFIDGTGNCRAYSVVDTYVDRLVADYTSGRSLRVAWDSGNGATGDIAAQLCARLPGEHILLNGAIDGTFPAHHPDPTVAENLEQIQRTVIERRCDVGIAFDGDGDRIGIVDNAGRIVWADQLMILLARAVLRELPGSVIVGDVKASQVLFDAVEAAGGTPLMSPSGYTVIKRKMAETGAPLAGEMSGHIFFADRYYGFDDALYVAVRTLSILSNADRSMAEFRDSLPPVVNTPELRLPCPEDRKFAIVREVGARLRSANAAVEEIDGVRVRTEDGWWLLRASNTQAVLAARCEAKDAAGLERLKETLRTQLRASGFEPTDF